LRARKALSVSQDQVTIGGKTQTVTDEQTGAPPEVRARREAIEAAKANERPLPEEALADLAIMKRH
jgi:hypothetical protein